MAQITDMVSNLRGSPCVYGDVEPSDPRPRHGKRRRALLVGFVVLALGLLLLSPTFGRAEPVGSYRPPLPLDALTDGCWPLPGDVRLGFGYQVRSDELIATHDGTRRMLVLHYDEISGEESVRLVREAFRAAGVDDVILTAVDFTDTAPDAVVRGQMVLELPPSRPEGRPGCREPFSTKKFPFDLDDRS